MGFLRHIIKNNGTSGLEQNSGNMRYDVTQPGNGPTIVLSQNGNVRTVIRPNGQIAQEWENGNLRFSSDKNGFDTLL